MRLLPVAAACFLFSATAAEKWKLQYFHDEDRASLTLVDIKFASPKRGVAVGAIRENDRAKPVALITSDGGVKWTEMPLKEQPISLFFLNESLGWMVTVKGIWQTDEGGLNWRKIKSPDGLMRVHFLDPQHGFAVGTRKQIYQTSDGGKNWIKAALNEDVKGNPDFTHFGSIDFAGELGMISGWNRPLRRGGSRFPAWVDPEAAVTQRQWPSVGIIVETKDRGKTWSQQSSSIFGRISKIRMSPDGWGIGLVEFDESFEYPSEIVLFSFKAGRTQSSYRSKTRKVSDILVAAPKGPIYLGAVELMGKLNQATVPGKVTIVKTLDAVNWVEMDVDYRAVARRVVLAMAGDKNLWAATDTGMILKLTP